MLNDQFEFWRTSAQNEGNTTSLSFVIVPSVDEAKWEWEEEIQSITHTFLMNEVCPIVGDRMFIKWGGCKDW